MKGTTTLQLIDPKTNKVIREVKHDNYITDFMQRYYAKHQYYHSTDVGQKSSLMFKDLCQGVLLFQNSMPTSGCVMPRSTDVVTGYASAAYTGDDTFKGSLNELESGEIENGYRKVWDFGTGVAVGTVSAVSLTTANCGNYGADSKDATAIKYQGVYSTNEYCDGTHNDVLDISKKYFLCSASSGSSSYPYTGTFNWNDFYFKKFNAVNIEYNFTTRIDPKRNASKNIIAKPTLEDTPEGYSRCACPSIDDTYFYVLYYKSATGFKVHKYKIETGAFIGETTYNFELANTPYRFKAIDGYICWSTSGTAFSVLDTDTLEVTSIASLFKASSRAIRAIAYNESINSFVIFGMSTITYSDSSVQQSICYFSLDTMTKYGEYQYNSSWNVYSSNNAAYRTAALYSDDVYNLIYGATTPSSSSGYVYHSILTFVPATTLATINNLPTPIQKGTEQVLKVVYDITW